MLLLLRVLWICLLLLLVLRVLGAMLHSCTRGTAL
jgi:hypothetical protein